MTEEQSYEQLKQQIETLNQKIISLENLIKSQAKKQAKVPVLLGKVDVQIDLDKEVVLPYPIHSLSQVEWEIKELTCYSPSMINKLFVDGKLRVHIDYNTKFPPYPVLSVIEEISFKKRKDFQYFHPPLSAHPVQKKEYSFATDPVSDVITHREKKMSVNEEIQCDLTHKQIISSEAMEIKENKTIIHLHVSLKLFFNLLQKQLIPLF